MTLPTRKPNRLKGYDYSSAGLYFVTICTKNMTNNLARFVTKTSDTSNASPDPQLILTETGNIVRHYIEQIHIKYPNVTVENYVIMPNHLHLLLRNEGTEGGTDDQSPTLGSVIGWFKYQSTVAVNEKRTSVKPLWQRSYHDHIVRNDQDYERIWNYIDNNPINWALDRYHVE